MPDYTITAPRDLAPEHLDLLTQVAADPHTAAHKLRTYGQVLSESRQARKDAGDAAVSAEGDRAQAARAVELMVAHRTRAERAEAAERSLLIRVAGLQLAADRVRPDVGPNALAEAAITAAEAIAGGDPEAMAEARTRLLSAVADGGGAK